MHIATEHWIRAIFLHYGKTTFYLKLRFFISLFYKWKIIKWIASTKKVTLVNVYIYAIATFNNHHHHYSISFVVEVGWLHFRKRSKMIYTDICIFTHRFAKLTGQKRKISIFSFNSRLLNCWQTFNLLHDTICMRFVGRMRKLNGIIALAESSKK